MADPTAADRCDAVGLIVESAPASGRVLLGVRTATPTSTRHPEVLSTPTMRVPPGLMEAALRDGLGASAPRPRLGEILALRDSRQVGIGVAMSLAEPLAFLTEGLLARKLGVAEELVAGRVRGSAAAAAIALDLVLDPGCEDGAPEITHMLSIHLVLDRGAELFPKATESYSRLHWVDAAELPAAVAGNRPLELIPDLDLNVCLHGLCVRSAAVAVAAGEI